MTEGLALAAVWAVGDVPDGDAELADAEAVLAEDALVLAALEALVSVDADWSRYKVLPAQRFTVATPQTMAVREGAIRAQFGVPASMVTSRFECGYLDNGRSALLQPGCRVVVRNERQGEVMAFRIPAAEIPAADPTWSEIGLLLKGGVP